MKMLTLAFVLFLSLGWLTTAFLAFYYVKVDWQRMNTEAAYEAMRGELEANLRTQGKGINNNYTCIKKGKHE